MNNIYFINNIYLSISALNYPVSWQSHFLARAVLWFRSDMISHQKVLNNLWNGMFKKYTENDKRKQRET